MTNATRILAASILACACMPATAQPSKEQLEKLGSILTESDANGDGKVTRMEYDAYRADIFAKLDRNGNGVASADDAPRVRVARNKYTSKLEQVLTMADKNGDGMLSRAEWEKPEKDIFALVDTDKDGVILLADLPKVN